MSLVIENHPSAQTAIDATARQLGETLSTLTDQSASILLLLSGGSNLNVAEKVRDVINNSAVTAYVLDERSSADPTLNNSLQLRAKGVQVNITVPEVDESLETFANRFNDELQAWLDQHPQGKVVCTWGMGPDGHVAGISPMSDAEKFQKFFLDTDALVVGYEGNLEPPQRVTVTPFFIQQHIDYLIGLVTGEAKEAAFSSFVEKSTLLHQHPVQLFHQSQGQVTIHTAFS